MIGRMGDVLTIPVQEVIDATPSTRILRLGPLAPPSRSRPRGADDAPPFSYLAGQAAFIGGHGHTLRRPYSIASAPEESAARGSLEFLIGLDAAGSPGPHLAGLAPGARVDLDGPYGSFVFPPHPKERHFLFIAGGTGIAPLRAMLRHALASEAGGRFALLYSARSPRDFAYASELRALEEEGRIELALTVTRDAETGWEGYRGRINDRRVEGLISDAATLCFICGPPALVADMPPLLRQLGIAPERIRTEEW